jgi:hypothetical protein
MTARQRKTEALKISTETYNKVYERDKGCIICKKAIHPKIIEGNYAPLECHHFVSRAKLGMGIEENLVMLCKYHHLEETTYRKDIEKYLKKQYPHWNRERLVFKK